MNILKTLGSCPKPYKLLKKFDQNFVNKQARCVCREINVYLNGLKAQNFYN